MKRLGRIPNPILRTAAFALVLAGLGLLAIGRTAAYPTYSTDGSSGNCANCHGDFGAANYNSRVDGSAWNDSLHNAHRFGMVNSDCDTCHNSAGFSPVNLGSSTGGDGLPPIGCVGCHGRSQDAGPGVSAGVGLMQHHTSAGVSTCTVCHAAAALDFVTPVGENVRPTYYADPGNGHSDMPTDACNPSPGFPEDRAGSTLGLDNDGDDVYDELDANCAMGGSCGDGILDPGEQCDDGNTLDGDCCAADCTFEPVDSPCDNGVFCTVDDSCDGMGTCTDGPARDCDDGDLCTNDSCNEAMLRCDHIFEEGNDPSCVCSDGDIDGFATNAGSCGAIDCDDSDPAIRPDASEICDDNRDNNCNGLIDAADPACGFSGVPDVWSGPLDDPDYAGSVACSDCHAGPFAAWRDTLHSRVQLRPGDAQAAGFLLPPLDQGGTIGSWDEVLFVVGQKWRSAYVDRSGTMQQPQWNYAMAGWQTGPTDETGSYDCGSCHSTGYDPDATFEQPIGTPISGVTGSWVEYGVGCEACHGPGAEHAAAPSRDNINRIFDDSGDPLRIDASAVCGACHTRDDVSGRRNRQHYDEWQTSAHSFTMRPTTISTYCAQCHSPGNADARSAEHFFSYFPPEDATHGACISCHDPHVTSQPRWAILEWPDGGQQQPKEFPAAISRYRGTDGDIHTDDHVPFDNDAPSELCTDCHKLQPGFRRHADVSPSELIDLMPPFNSGEPFLMPHRVHAERGWAECTDCHMHYSRESANPGDIRSHTLVPSEAPPSPGPHYSETCGACHDQATGCVWCHGQFSGSSGRIRLLDGHGADRTRPAPEGRGTPRTR